MPSSVVQVGLHAAPMMRQPQRATHAGRNHRGPIFLPTMIMTGCNRIYVMKNDMLIRLSGRQQVVECYSDDGTHLYP
jgi:hypothetical protein